MNHFNVEQLGLQANLTPEQREYFDKLKAELLEIFGADNYETLLAKEETTRLRQVREKLDQIIKFLGDREATEWQPWTPERFADWAEQLGLDPEWCHQQVVVAPNRIVVEDDFTINNASELPPSLVVNKRLIINNTTSKRLPHKLTAAALGLNVGVLLNTWPEEMHILRGMEITHCDFHDWPPQRTFYNLMFHHVPIKEIPAGVKIDNNLVLVDTEIEHLPDDLIVKGELTIPQRLWTQAKELEKRGQVGRICVTFTSDR